MDIHVGLAPYHRGMRRTLAACIAAVLSASAWSADVPAGSYVVTDCGDAGPGTLRDALAQQVYGIDVTACTQITLVSGPLVVTSNTASISGDHTLVTSSGASRILTHTGTGNLWLHGLEIADGAETGTQVRGGCIASQGSVHIDTSIVRDCTITGTTAQFDPGAAFGGAIYAREAVSLIRTTVRDSTVVGGPSTYSSARGGGVFAGDTLSLSNSTISGNTVVGGVAYAYGGGAVAQGGAYIGYSTISTNTAPTAGGLAVGNGLSASTIIDSTISGNTANMGGAGVQSSDALLRIWNSTIAFNHLDNAGPPQVPIGAGVRLHGNHAYLVIHSSILARNDSAGMPDDLSSVGPVTITGSADIIGASLWPVPPDTISADPLLLPLADNGGAVWTHALHPGSPAIDHGDNGMQRAYDARGYDFDRVVGAAPDIGAFEVQAGDSIFENGFD
ncbi:MAG: choice-of-anchor Q domain-containing protein [Dokdonella sp.]|uniref:choice-of-anchor Q domain-containing protein n=1 Tax=Dokdonella sp. TaxID=2291710 RepID=UPI003F8141B0